MAQTLLTHEKMISNLIGDFSPSEHPELYRAGFHFIADLIPVTNELWATSNLKGQSIPTNGFQVRGSTGSSHTHLKVISVWRYANFAWIKCKEVPWDEFRRGKDINSIYSTAHTGQSPIYSISDSGRIHVAPKDAWNSNLSFEGEVPFPQVLTYMRYWSYEPQDFFGISDDGDTFDSYDITEDLSGFPRDAQLAAIIKSSMNILQVKMGEAVHEDEDSELLQLQQAQFAQLGQWFESELSRLNIQSKKLGIEEE